MASRSGGRQKIRGGGVVGERRGIVQAMRARGRAGGRGRGGGRSPAFEVDAGVATLTTSFQQLFRQARASGSLNLTSRGLEHVPDEVFNLPDGVDAAQGEKFWEVCELQRLDLSFNRIGQLPEKVSSLSVLAWLKMRKNALSSVPPALFALECLSLLDLAGNAIQELPEEVGAAVAMKALLLSGNRLSGLPSSIGNLEALETLELSDNALGSLPETMGNMSRLTKLTVSNNRLTCLPESLGRLTSVTLLDVSRNSISRFPEGLCQLGALVFLDARENSLQEVPPLPQGDRLAQLFLGFNSIAALDGATLLRVSGGLFELHVQNNHIVHLSEEIGSLARLKTLDVSNNDLPDLPAALGYLPELHRLAVDGNPLRTVRRSLLTGGASALKTYLRTRGPCPDYPGLDAAEEDAGADGGSGQLSANATLLVSRSAMETGTLDVEGRGLKSLPADLFEGTRKLSAVTRAKFNGNKFQTLPETISRFQSLTALDADNNMLSSLPATLADLGIQRLVLRRNRLSSPTAVDAFLAPSSSVMTPPGSLALSRSIRELDLSSNGLEEVPESLFACRGLQTLILGFNALSDVSGLPWAALSSLETLDLSSNRLLTLGDVVLMTWLRRLNLENNDINPVPMELGLCTALESLLLAGNPQRQVSASLLQRGTAATLAYLRDRLPPGHRPRSAATPPPPPLPAAAAAAGRGDERVQNAASAGAAEGDGGRDRDGHNREALARIAALRAEVAALAAEMDAPGMSQAKAYALKKKLQMKRAAAMREERALKQR